MILTVCVEGPDSCQQKIVFYCLGPDSAEGRVWRGVDGKGSAAKGRKDQTQDIISFMRDGMERKHISACQHAFLYSDNIVSFKLYLYIKSFSQKFIHWLYTFSKYIFFFDYIKILREDQSKQITILTELKIYIMTISIFCKLNIFLLKISVVKPCGNKILDTMAIFEFCFSLA